MTHLKNILEQDIKLSPVPVIISTPETLQTCMTPKEAWISIQNPMAGVFVGPTAKKEYYLTNNELPDTFIWINSEIEVYRQLTALWHETQHAQCLNSKCNCRSYENIDGHPNVMLEYHAYLATLIIAVKKQLPLPFLQVIQNVIQLASEKQQPYANACKMIQKLQMFKHADNQYWRNYEKKDHNIIHPWPKNNDNQWQIEWETIKCNGNIPQPINENPILNPLNHIMMK